MSGTEDCSPIMVGQPAPDFELESSAGEPIRLSEFRGKAEVVLFFYPKDDTPGCTIEACSFRDSHEAFREAGAEVIGISSDSGPSHRRFAERYGLNFRLLSDPDGAVRARYGVSRTFGMIPGRATFVIDRQGVVRHVFSSQFRPSRHVGESLEIIRSLRGPAGEASQRETS